MPSNKTPASLLVGPGRLPANVVPASALTSIPTSASVNGNSSAVVVVTVSSVTTLTRQAQQMLILVDTTSAGFTVTIPHDGQVGDTITFVMSTASTNALTIAVPVAGGPTNEIQGHTTSETLVGAYQSRTYVRVTFTGGTSDWTTVAEKPSIQALTATTALLRAGASTIVLVDASGGNVTVTLPVRAIPGDRVTIINTVSTANLLFVLPNAGSTIDGRTSTLLTQVLGSATYVRVNSTTWATLSETPATISITDSFTFSSGGGQSTNILRLLVHTNNGAWIAGTKTVVLNSTITVQVGTTLSITDIDGAAETNPINVTSVIGLLPGGGTSNYVISRNYGSLSLIYLGGGNWAITAEDTGLVPNYFSVYRADDRSDVSQSRATAAPMINWSERRVAVHSEFTSLVTNIFPVEGFTAGGSILLSEVPDAEALTAGMVGNLRMTLPSSSGSSGIGYMHWGSTPSSNVFQIANISGFRAIVRITSASPGTNWNVAIGFGDNFGLGAAPALAPDQMIGDNGLYFNFNSSGFWRHVRRATTFANSITTSVATTVGNRFVLEMYKRTGSNNWDGYVNGIRSTGNTSNIPAVPLNFGVFVRAENISGTYVLDVDSLTVFTLDMTTTRHT